MALSPFAKRLVGAAGGTLHIISVEHAARAAQPAAILIDSMPSAHGVVTALVYSCDGRRVLSAGEDGKLRLWRVAEDGEAGTI